ncbi:hypothetical protein TNCV_2309541 [Trichonephila clavipes]|nr:hypothetical protein TNCV_2309541 [Trichonephila clavipes]
MFFPHSYKNCKKPILPQRALLVKLYYRNCENAAAAVIVPPSQGTTTCTDVDECSCTNDDKIQENRTVRHSSWKRTKKRQDQNRRGYCYSGQGNKE